MNLIYRVSWFVDNPADADDRRHKDYDDYLLAIKATKWLIANGANGVDVAVVVEEPELTPSVDLDDLL